MPRMVSRVEAENVEAALEDANDDDNNNNRARGRGICAKKETAFGTLAALNDPEEG